MAAAGAVIAAAFWVESGDGAFRWTGAVGDANSSGVPMRGDTPFFIASITKLGSSMLFPTVQPHPALDG
jgi:hypothetical protein